MLNITYGWVGAWSFRRCFYSRTFNTYPIIVSIAILIIQSSAVIVFEVHLVTDTLSFPFCWIVDSQIIRAKCSVSQTVRSVPLKYKVYCHYGQSVYVGKIFCSNMQEMSWCAKWYLWPISVCRENIICKKWVDVKNGTCTWLNFTFLCLYVVTRACWTFASSTRNSDTTTAAIRCSDTSTPTRHNDAFSSTRLRSHSTSNATFTIITPIRP